MGLLRQTPSRKDIGQRKTVGENMEGFHCSMQTTSIHEEWMNLVADIVNNDLENDLENKKLSDFSGFDVVGLFNNNSDKSFQRQQSYQDILNDIEGEELMLGIDSTENAICIDNTSNNNNNTKVVVARETGSLTGYSQYYSPASPTDSCFSTDDFPKELDELQPFEEMEGDQLVQVAATFTLEVINSNKNKDSSDSNPDFDPEDFEEVVRPTKKTQRIRKEATSDYESEELSEEEKPQRNLQGSSRRSRKPSRNP